MRVVAIIQARLSSSRFPNKTLAILQGQPLIRHVVDRVSEMQGLSAVIVACPSERDRDVLALACQRQIPFWADEEIEESDLLSRYAACARSAQAGAIVRVTSDCPLWNPRIGEEVLALFQKEAPRCEYVTNAIKDSGYCDGEDVEIFSAKALEWANREADRAYDREHIGPWFLRHVNCKFLPPANPGRPKTSIDTPEDLARVEALLRVTA